VGYSGKYWKFREKGENIHLYCPILTQGVSTFKAYREIYKELKLVENSMYGRYPNAVMFTGINHPHIMKLMAKVGYSPYYLNLEKETIWFKKPLRR
jgi:hypothetical protein